MALDKETLTRIYNEANGIGQGKNPPISTEYIFNAMQAIYALGVADERERCAKLCEQTYETGFAAEPQLPCFDTAVECAEAIRKGVK